MTLAEDALADGRRPKRAFVLARQIENEIVKKRPPLGMVLGSEPELIARYGVSRGVFREAIRSVEQTGLATMRRGPSGGLVVTEPSQRAVSEALSILFSYMGVSAAELAEVRLPLQLSAARWAAERIDESGIVQLRSCLAELDAAEVPDEEAYGAFERLVLELCGNPVVMLFGGALLTICMSRVRGTGGRVEPPVTIEDRDRQRRSYHRLADAIIRGDTAEAQRRMTAVLGAFERRLVDRPARTRPRRTPVIVGSGKLAERVAAAIREDIEYTGWEIGRVLGSEPDLIDRFGVSRSVFREAIRLLEQHNAVRTRRGPGGGIVVAEPDVAGVMRAVEIALEFERVTAADIFEVRAAIDMASVRRAAERCTDADVAELREAIAAEGSPNAKSSRHFEFHQQLATISGNRPMALFMELLSHLALAHTPRRQARRRNVGELQRAHEAILEALIERDSALAEHRMGRHLAAVGDH